MSKPFYTKKPCQHCPYRKDVKPFLRASRGKDLAYHTTNPYNSFPCHKTTVSDEIYGGNGSNMVCTNKTLECAGFLTLQIVETQRKIPNGFTPDFDNVYKNIEEMIEAYSYNV